MTSATAPAPAADQPTTGLNDRAAGAAGDGAGAAVAATVVGAGAGAETGCATAAAAGAFPGALLVLLAQFLTRISRFDLTSV